MSQLGSGWNHPLKHLTTFKVPKRAFIILLKDLSFESLHVNHRSIICVLVDIPFE